MPKQVGLIIPRGPFLNLKWFVGLLEGDNWIHIELATGMHTRSTVECKCTLGHTQANTHIRVYTNARTRICPLWDLDVHVHYARTHTQTNEWQWKEDWDWVGTGSWVMLPLVPTRLRVPHSAETTSGMCVCMFARESVNLSGWETDREREMWVWLLRVFKP